MRADQLSARLADRYALPEWVYLAEVRSSTGSYASRTADALALNCYPSRGLALHGFEIKTARSDWVKELKDASKADRIARYCDYWWLVVSDRKIVHDGELPKGWGLLVPNGDGLIQRMAPTELEAGTWDRGFVASLLRNCLQASASKAAIQRAYDEGFATHKATTDHRDEYMANRQAQKAEQDRSQLDKIRKAFRDACGLDITTWNASDAGKAVREVFEMKKHAATIRRLPEVADQLKATATRLVDALGNVL